MKRFSTILMLALAFALVASTASAAGYTFSKTLKLKSAGADVVALQTILESKGLLTMPAGVAKGYFGGLTFSAVKAYQTSKGLQAVGQVGPATRGALNLEGEVVASGVAGCGAGAMFSSVTGQACTTTSTGGTSAVVGMATPGVAGTLSASLWTTPSGVTAYKGQSYDIAGYKIQAAASDMAVTSIAFDFDTRFWLYANAITVKDEAGRVVGQVSNLNASNFTELTVGSAYRINVPVTGLVVKATQAKYLTLNASFSAVTDRTTTPLNVTSFQIRAVDGTGVTDTLTVNATQNGGVRPFTFSNTTVGQLIITTNIASPVSQVVQVSTAAQTQNVPLAIFDIKSQNQASTLQGLTVGIATTSGSGTLATMFANVQIKAGGLTYSASSMTATSAVFTNLSIPLNADVYTPVTVLATLAQDTNNFYDGTTIRVSLTPATTTGALNPSIIDATYNNVVPTSVAPLYGNYLTFSAAGITTGTLTTNVAAAVPSTATASSSQNFTFTYSLTAGNNPIYVSSSSTLALEATTTGSVGTVSLISFRDSDSTGDGVGYFYLAPGQSKTFTASFISRGGASGTYSITGLNYGSAWSGSAVTGTGSLNAPLVGSTLFASLGY
jgi:hypothetical protein